MKQNLLKIVLGLVLILGLAGTVWASGSIPVGTTTFYLSGAGITATASTIQLTSFNTPDGRALTMANFGSIGYGALEVGTSKLEDISFTGITQNANGTAILTGVTRGIDFIYPYASTLSLEKAHAGGSTFTITNTAAWYYNEVAMYNNNAIWPTASSSVASKGYADYLAFNGAAVINATQSGTGVVQVSTAAQAAATSNINGGPYLVLSSAIATSTYNANTAASKVPVTGVGGLIDPKFIFNGQSITFPAAGGTASSTLLNNGSGTTYWGGISYLLGESGTVNVPGSSGSTTLFTATVPANGLSTNNVVRVQIPGALVNPASTGMLISASYGGLGTTTLAIISTAGEKPGNMLNLEYDLFGNGATNSQKSAFWYQIASTTSSANIFSPFTVPEATSSIAADSTKVQTLLIQVNDLGASDTFSILSAFGTLFR